MGISRTRRLLPACRLLSLKHCCCHEISTRKTPFTHSLLNRPPPLIPDYFHPAKCYIPIPTQTTHANDRHHQTPTMVADALIYHPAITHYQKFVATTSKSSCIHIYSTHTLPLCAPFHISFTNNTQLTPPSRPRQDSPHHPVLLALPRLVHPPHQPLAIHRRRLQWRQEELRCRAQGHAPDKVH